IIEYTISFHNQGKDGAIRVAAVDPIPEGLIYLPNSIQILRDDGDPSHVGPQTDATDTDFAEFVPGAPAGRGTLHFRFGAGATGGSAPTPAGGTLLADQGVILRYRAKIAEDFPGGTITNEVAISHGSLTFPDDPDQNVSGETDTQVLVEPVPQLLVAKMANPSAIPDAAGEPVEFMLIVRAYDAPVNSVNVSDT